MAGAEWSPLLAAPPGALALGLPLVVSGGVLVWLLVHLSRHPEADPGETAVGYELAWDRLDFPTLWQLSAPRLRDGRSRDRFLADKRGAYEDGRSWRHLVVRATAEAVELDGEEARVVVRLALRDGGTLLDEVLLERAGGPWRVSSCRMLAGPGDA